MKTIFLEEIDSTNKYTKENIENFDDFTIVYANKQTAGRGRFDRKWEASEGENLYASIVLKPSKDFKEVYSNLTQYLCMVLAEVFEEYNICPKIKWPNDIRINGKKISGILAESVMIKNKLVGIVLGFGVNLNCSEEFIKNINQPATSLNLETGMEIDRKFFLNKVINKFCLGYNKFIEEGFISIRKEYIERAEFLNKTITIKVFNNEYTGVAKNVTSNGAIKIVDENNKEQVFLIGDIL